MIPDKFTIALMYSLCFTGLLFACLIALRIRWGRKN